MPFLISFSRNNNLWLDSNPEPLRHEAGEVITRLSVKADSEKGRQTTHKVSISDGVRQPLLGLVLPDLHLGQLVALGLDGLLQLPDVQLLEKGNRVDKSSTKFNPFSERRNF